MTQLPLDKFREILGYNPWHFWGWANSTYAPVSSKCNSVVKEFAWQNVDAAGRKEIRDAIQVAESRLREYLNYSIGRNWITETLQYPRPYSFGKQYAGSVGGDGRWLNLRTHEGYIRAIGVLARETLDSTATVVYSDDDGDGLDETFTLTIAGVSSTLDTSQVAVYFNSADRLDGEPVGDDWKIAPIKTSLSGTTLTIKGRSWLLGKPIKYRGFTTANLDPTDSSNFASTLEVYREYTDPNGITTDDCQATLVWETEPYPYWAISCTSSNSLSFDTNSQDPAAVAYAIARAGIRDARKGEVTVGRATYNSDTGEWNGTSWGTCRQPDRVILRYEAGAQLESNGLSRVDVRWTEIIARLAAAELSQRICGCDTANRELYRWQSELAGQQDQTTQISSYDLNNPFGTRRGMIYAFRRVRDMNNVNAYIP